MKPIASYLLRKKRWRREAKEPAPLIDIQVIHSGKSYRTANGARLPLGATIIVANDHGDVSASYWDGEKYVALVLVEDK